jgi:hypothetical protein
MTPELKCFTLAEDASVPGNQCKELDTEIPIRISVVPNVENPDAKAPTFEGPKEDLVLTPSGPQLYLSKPAVTLNQDGDTGVYDLKVEAEGLTPYVVQSSTPTSPNR